MTAIETKYTPGRYGLGTQFSESDIPIEYSAKLVNRFINLKGHAEKIQGLDPMGKVLSPNGSVIPGAPTITGLHEHIGNSGVVTLMASTNGNIWKINETTGVWTQILTGKDPSKRLNSVQMGEKLIFTNGSDKNFYTDDGGATFKELVALMERGQGSSTSTSGGGLSDSNITNWLTETFVTDNDLIYNSTQNAYGIITSVGTTNIQHTTIGSGATGIGLASGNQNSGDFYQIIDLVELNIIPQNNGFDNFATLTSGTTSSAVAVSGVDWTKTEVRVGDFIYNTTRAAVTQVSAVSTAALTVAYVSGQISNDTIELFKSAMPIASWAHVHFGRAYYIDARTPSLVRISGPSDPQDLTTFQRTLSSTSQDYGSRQPQAETLLSLKTFQAYLVANGERNIYADSGVNSIQDTTAATTNFFPVGVFPQGGVSRYVLESIGGAMTFLANDGLRNFAASFGNLSFQTANISESIKSDLSAQIKSKITDPDEIQTIHYPRRNWLLCKVGDVIYNYNYTPTYINGQVQASQYGSWSIFNSKIAQQKCYFIRRNGDLICAGKAGKVYVFEAGHYEDDGDSIQTVIETGWLTLNEPQLSTQYRTGCYIRTQFEAGAAITYTITATGDYSQISTDTVLATAAGVGEVGFAQVGIAPIGGQRILDKKLSLRWKGKQFKIRIETDDSFGPDIITGFTIYGNILGKI